MAAKFVAVLCLCACASAIPLSKVYAEPAAAAHYEYQYSVHDPLTHDIKRQQEARQGDAVHGSYSLLQPDGRTRVVHYTADKEHGFNAVVTYEGHPTEAPHAPAAAPAPVLAKVAHVAPVVAKVAHVAPVVAKLAYTPVSYTPAAAPAKVAYTENLAHISYSSPIVSYHY